MNKLLLGLMIGSLVLTMVGQSLGLFVCWTLSTAAHASQPQLENDRPGAIAVWRVLAEKGDAEAAANLGQAYLHGDGVARDLVTAEYWLSRAARQNNADAQATLGLLQLNDGRRQSAMPWIEKAVNAGDPRALLVLGRALYSGDEVAKDEVRAYAYISRSAAQGLQPAKATLAELDGLMSIEKRREGVALALQLASPAVTNPALRLVDAKTDHAQPATANVAVAAREVSLNPEAGASIVGARDGGWRIQLGAFSKRGFAENLSAKLSTKLKGRQSYYVPFRNVIRLQVGSFESSEEARETCSKLAPNPCMVVPIK